MRIIKKGNPDAVKSIRFTCVKCECIYEAFETECIKAGTPLTMMVYQSRCPFCTQLNFIEEKLGEN